MKMAELKISAEVTEKLVWQAKDAGLSVDKLAEVLLAAFVDNDGKVYVGKWREGPGIKLLPDWPRFSSSIVKIKQEELK